MSSNLYLARRVRIRLAVVALSLSMMVAGAARADLNGRRVSLTQPPAWALSGAFDSRGNVLLPDPFNRELATFSVEGARTETLPASALSASPEARPSTLARTEGGFALRVGPSTIQWLDDRGARVRALDFLGRPVRLGDSQGELRSLYNWTVTRDRLVSYSDIRLPGDQWITRLVACPLTADGACTALAEPALERSHLVLYLVGNPYLAAIGDDVYFLSVGGDPVLYRLRPDRSGNFVTERLAKLDGFTRPALGTSASLQDAGDVYAKLEAAAMPTGLYSWNDRLYLVARTPRAGGQGSDWSLVHLSTDSGQPVSRERIDTDAHHLVTIPGAPSWAFVEKGPVERLGVQQVRSALFVDTRQIHPAE